jgi:hypothetical protein
MLKALSVAGIALIFSVSAVRAEPVELISPDFRGAIQPQVAVAPSGVIHVVFGRKESGAIFHVGSRDGGRTWSKPVQVERMPKLALGMRRGPRITATDKLATVTAISHGDGNLHAWTSADGGATWSPTAEVNDTPQSAREGLHALAGDGRGLVAVAWLDDRAGAKEVWSAVSRDGGATWGRNVQTYKSPEGHVCECCAPTVAVDAQGRIAIMWRNSLAGSRDMFTAVSSDGGSTYGAAQKLGSGTWKLNACPMDGGAIAFGASGKLMAAWRRERTVFATEGAGPEQRLADSALQPLIVVGKSGAYYLWESGGGLVLRKGSSSPQRLAGNARFAAAAPLPNRGIIVVWEGETNGTNTVLADVLD